jgi:phosphatidate cytidylyltransferase
VFGLFLPLSPGAVFSPYLFEATLADHASPILISLMACLLGIFLLMFVELFMGSDAPFSNIGHVLLGLMYLGLPFSLLVSIAFWHGDYAPMRVFGLLLLNWTNDTMAYVVGSKIGKTPFFTRISPNKTWEGTLGGVFFTFVVATIFALWLPSFQPAEWLTMAAMVGIFGTAGDLIESMLKRSIRVKDSGSFLPGHGGFLDRFDSFVFALPFVWFALMLLEG